MDNCRHQRLVLIKPKGKKLRCRQCHLTIDPDELGNDWCPECLEARGVRCRDFEEIEEEEGGRVAYRCEDCGALIHAGEEISGNPGKNE